MKIAIPKERRPGERRVAVSPDVVKKLAALGLEIAVETGAGDGSSFADAAYKSAGAEIAPNAAAALGAADMVWKVRAPEAGEIAAMRKDAILVAHMAALTERAGIQACADAGLTVFAMELMPRITRAQGMDVLSSQSNLAGYRAVIEAASEFGRGFPMMMTAAGTVAPAKVFVMGVGVAGLQAIATAKRMGAVVTAYDVRAATKEQVESLGGKFVVVDAEAMKTAQTAGGYAKEMTEDYRKKEQAVIAEHIKKQDIVITTALIPGKRAPVLVTEEMVRSLAPGSVIVDLAVEAGGNCAGAEADKIVVKNGVKIVGYTDMSSRIAADSSALYARNLLNFLTPLLDKQTHALAINWDDEIVKGTLVARDGRIVHPLLASGGN
ncbi:MAG: Re/Si-specific NAD(P)(+) transhydrogenase subunit alpha [Rhodospirillales bacterium]|nr:Re/Si-specific NAD(P)(+) transhydrogenase subunit alpha [Rhodospirillales bacterium]MSP79460.1 Re/Si-specific NAD(P)(+) transhydrogenase subunit alpha [Rhodospirillales bacterium]